MSTIASPAEERVFLRNISWSTYEAILDDAATPRGRIAYDEGTLEIMVPLLPHENAKRGIGRLIEVFTEELQIDIRSVSSTTFKRKDVLGGFEADESYYVAHAAEVRGKEEIDLTVDPPPDLVIEIDISRTSMNKLRIYGALGVPEVWLYDGSSLRIYVHRQGEQYEETSSSDVLPGLPIEKLIDFLSQRHTLGETEWIRAFRKWVRQQFGIA
jgi:Uma2 family endonuclease